MCDGLERQRTINKGPDPLYVMDASSLPSALTSSLVVGARRRGDPSRSALNVSDFTPSHHFPFSMNLSLSPSVKVLDVQVTTGLLTDEGQRNGFGLPVSRGNPSRSEKHHMGTVGC
ncbi:unnamed protein product [Pleuronectes platessa]|uniref:Uncharacterized protein n=1 Tax=Pleuronectes platessa TaxID=8262 RepID=A0A9N7Z4Y4_PLEPL|nr:unnamed protein product [Pleuronectes platessa]